MATYTYKKRVNYEDSKRLQDICSEPRDLVLFFDNHGRPIGSQSEPSKRRVGDGMGYYILTNAIDLLSICR